MSRTNIFVNLIISPQNNFHASLKFRFDAIGSEMSEGVLEIAKIEADQYSNLLFENLRGWHNRERIIKKLLSTEALPLIFDIFARAWFEITHLGKRI